MNVWLKIARRSTTAGRPAWSSRGGRQLRPLPRGGRQISSSNNVPTNEDITNDLKPNENYHFQSKCRVKVGFT